jgi:hypothetical protein
MGKGEKPVDGKERGSASRSEPIVNVCGKLLQTYELFKALGVDIWKLSPI